MDFIPDKPSHSRFVFNQLNGTQYKTYANQYSKAKRGGFRCVYAWASGTGVVSVIGNIGKGVVIDYGKKNLLLFVLAQELLSYHQLLLYSQTLQRL